MGTKMYKGRVMATAKMKEKNPAAVEHSSAQIVKKPRMKKNIQKRQIKTRLARRRPVDSTSQQKKGRGRSQDSNSHKRMIAYSPKEKRLKTYCNSLKVRPVKSPTESRVNCIPPKTANKQEQSNSPGMKVEDRNSCSHECKTENPQLPLMKRPQVIITRVNQRSKPSEVEKRRYHAVSEYQFIYPGRAMFYCTRESVRQQLRSIYLGPRGQKPLKPSHQSTQKPHYNWETIKTQWENTKTDAICPIGSEFLRRKHLNTIPHGFTSLMYKMNKLVLVNEMETVVPCTPVGFPHSPQLQHPPPPSKSHLPAAVLQSPSSSKERKMSSEGWHVEKESSPDSPLQGATRNVLKASLTSFTKPRPLSAKEYYGKMLSKKSGGEDNQNGDSSKEVAAESTLVVSITSKRGVTHTRSTNAVQAFHPFSSKGCPPMLAQTPSSA